MNSSECTAYLCKGLCRKHYNQQPHVKKVQNAWHRRWRKEHPEEAKKKDRQRYRRNPHGKIAASRRYYLKNRETRLPQMKRWNSAHKRDPAKVRASRLRMRYGISQDEYDLLHRKQKGRCAICRKKAKKLYVDHCHKSRRIRGLLCPLCNTGIAFLKESRRTLLAAVRYLK